jgi:hypothetical protein
MYGIYESGTIIAQFVAPMAVRSNHPVFASDTLSLKRDIIRRSAQRWEIETRLMPLSVGAENLFVNLVSKGYSDTVTIITPQNYGAKKALTATAAVTGTGSKDTNIITVDGNNGVIPKGTFIKFASHSKVYLTITERNNNGTMLIYPNLLSAVAAASFTYKDDVQMSCMWDLNTINGMSYSDGILMDLGTVKLVEKV